NALWKTVMDSLHKEPLEIIYNEGVLDTNLYLVEKTLWAAIINKVDTIDFNELSSLEEPFRLKKEVDNTTLEMKKQMIKQLADRYIIVQAARAAKIDTLPHVVEMEASLRQEYTRKIVERDRYDKAWKPSDSMINSYYEEHLDEYRIDKPLRIQHIIVEDSMTGEFVRDQALAGVDFLELALEYYPGEKSIRVALADLGYIGPDDVPSEIYRIALITAVGNVSHPVKTQYGYSIVKVLEHHDEIGFARASNKIVPILKKRHDLKVFQAYRDRLYEKFNVSFPGKLHAIHLKPLEYRNE
ncbi:MAG: peptidyl-prolyl cis-trans isomerase, partial [candidate division Zixibacteria bacterium]|nr:peptidyl-prolyl cis-trans isomerase [candidate division Zixibacteria bacterium]